MARRIVMLALLVAFCTGGAFAQITLDSRHADFNPALMAISPRRWVEIGLGAGTGAYNAVFAPREILTETWVIDLDHLADSAGTTGLPFGTTARAGTHAALRVAGLGLGLYARTTALANLVVPAELTQLLAEGNVKDQTGTGNATLRAVAEYGASVTAGLKGWTIGVNVGQYVPIFWSGDAGVTFEVITTDAGISAAAALDAVLYSAVDLAALEQGAGPEAVDLARAGLKVDVGIIRKGADGRPVWGVAINDITIVPARSHGEYRLTGSYSASVEHALDAAIEGNDPLVLEGDDLELTHTDVSDRRIGLPPAASGFYRFSVAFLDIIPHARIVFDRELGMLNPGLTVAGNRFPASLLFFGIGRDQPTWHAVAGLRVPLRVIELTVRLDGTSSRLLGAFRPEGLSAAVDLRIGL